MAKQDRPYNLSAAFEAAAVVLACTRPQFYGRIGYAISHELLSSSAGALALKAAQSIARDTGSGPGSSLLVFQRLHRWREDGAVTMEQITDVLDLFDDAEDATLPDEDGVVTELAPVLQQRLRDAGARVAIDAAGKSKSLSAVVELEKRAARIGHVDTSIGCIIGDASFADIEELQNMERLEIGVPEIDQALEGGHQRGGLCLWIGSSGDGKSMALSHCAGVHTRQKMLTCYATLELPRPQVQARIIANMTGLPINAILRDKRVMNDARDRLRAMDAGTCVVQEFPPQGTTLDDLFHWIDNTEQQIGQEVQSVYIDYLDKVVASMKKQDSDYHQGRIVFEGFRNYIAERNKFGWSASQATRRKKSRGNDILGLDDISDSMHKARVADLVMTINLSEDQSEVSIFVAKHRTAPAKKLIGPLPTEYGFGRLSPLSSKLL